MNNNIVFTMHIMWYESLMINETLDSLVEALHFANIPIELNFCFNSQTYLEKPLIGKPEEMFEKFKNHSIFKNYNIKIVHKTDKEPFYNIADWRREQYYPESRYTVWGESDTLVPKDFFYILQNVEISEPHLLSFSSRKMWDETWKEVEHVKVKEDNRPHTELGILSCGEYINYKQLCEINENNDIQIVQISTPKIDGALLSLSNNLPSPFLPLDMHFHGEDTCVAMFFRHHNIPQYNVMNRIKGHNYNHPLKRTNTNNTRDENTFKEYHRNSIDSMQRFLNGLK
jgi:hypothetical protein